MYNHLWDQNWLKAQPWLHHVCCQVLFRLRVSLLSCPFVCLYKVHTCEVHNSEASPGRLLPTRSSTNSLFKASLVISVYLGPYPSALEHILWIEVMSLIQVWFLCKISVSFHVKIHFKNAASGSNVS